MPDYKDSGVESRSRSFDTESKDCIAAGFVDSNRRDIDIGWSGEDMVDCSIPYYWVAGMGWFGNFGSCKE